MKTLLLFALATAGLHLQAQVAPDEDSWPRSYTVDGAEVVLYEPSIEKWQGTSLEARFAVGIKVKGSDEPAYGSFVAHADALASTDTRTATLFNFSAEDVKFPDAPDRIAEFTRIINALAPEKPVKVPLDKLIAGVPPEDVVTKITVTTPTLTKAPKVIVRFDNTVLVAFDGKPIFRSIPGTGLEAAVNTPATLLRPDSGGPLFLLTNDGVWLQSPGWAGPWKPATVLPPGMDDIPPDHPVAQAIKNVWPPTGAVVSVPEVVTSETPTELIQIEGKPRFDQIAGLPLVRVSNTESALFYHTDQDTFYVLISGRWFIAQGLTGPWTYVPHNELPAAFAQIPEDDPAADVRASVAGTREAEEAVKEAQIPDYARVNVREAPEIAVEYDGAPIFEDVEDTRLSYAVNTTYAVIRFDGRYYCCHNGLWFVADAAWGAPWRCATVIPQEIYLLPPSSPLYHVRFCEVDSYYDDYVVYRSTPGYWGTYVDPWSHVCVYGTGWWYPSYVSRDYYCGHSWTYGMGCRYVPRRGFVRHCDRVAHTSWFRRSEHRDSYCRADSDRWGGRFERGHWRGSRGRTVAYSDWDGRVKRSHDELATSIRRRDDRKHADEFRSGEKPKVISHGRDRDLAKLRFDKDVRAGQQGDVFRRDDDGWKRRESGKWTLPDKDHPVDPKVVRSRGKHDSSKDKLDVAASKSREFDREFRGLASAPRAIPLEKGRAPHESSKPEIEIRTAKPAHQDNPRSTFVPGRDPRVERQMPRADDPPVYRSQPGDNKEKSKSKIEQRPPSRIDHDPVPELRRVEPKGLPRSQPKVDRVERNDQPPQMRRPEHRDSPPKIQPREAPRSVERYSPPPKIQQREAPRSVERYNPPKIQQREAPRSVERHNPPPRIQQREAPRSMERHNPPKQIHRDPPRRMEQSNRQPDRSSGSRDSHSNRGNDKKDDKNDRKK